MGERSEDTKPSRKSGTTGGKSGRDVEVGKGDVWSVSYGRGFWMGQGGECPEW